jgi:hypothetical protein
MAIRIKRIMLDICEPCLEGQGEECHTPGCALYLHRVDLPIAPEVYDVYEVMEWDDKRGLTIIAREAE